MRTLGAALAVVALAATAGCGEGLAAVGADSKTYLQIAYDSCKPDKTLDIADQGHTLFIDTGEDGDVDGAVCVFFELDTPKSVINQMDSTTAMMGRQKMKTGGFTYVWSYHPDNGLNVMVTEE